MDAIANILIQKQQNGSQERSPTQRIRKIELNQLSQKNNLESKKDPYRGHNKIYP